MYRDHRKGPGGPPGGATYPGGPRGLKVEGNQPLVGWGAPPWASPHAPRVGNPRGEFPLALGGKAPLPPHLAAAPPGSDLQGPAPPPRGLYKGGREGSTQQPWAPPSSPATPLSLSRRSLAKPCLDPLHPPPRRRAAGSPSTSPSPLLDQEGGDVAAPYVC